MPFEEKVVLVDERDQETGIAEKLAAHRAGLLHRAFSVIIWDDRGRQLLQKRAMSKYHSAGLWTNACCGHPRPGESVADAAARRLTEEMRITCPLEHLGTVRYRADFENGLTEHEIVHIYRGRYTGPVEADPAEAEDVAWRALSDIRDEAAAHPEYYTVWFRTYLGEDWTMARA